MPPDPAPQADPLRAHVRFCTEHIRRIVAEIGPRPPGSPAERQAQEYLAGLLRKLGVEPSLEPFPAAP